MDMKKQRIEIILKNVNVVYFQGLLVDFFSRDRSPDYPVHVLFDSSLRPSKTPGHVAVDYYNFRIGESSNDEDEPSKELAKIVTQSYPSHIVVFVESEESNDWKKVENLIRNIIAKTHELELEIISVQPPELMPTRLLPPWERIPDHFWDRQAVKMWNEGHTNREISNRVGVTPEAVTNRISELRKEFTIAVVPYKKDIRRKGYS